MIDHEINYLPEGDRPGRFPYSHRTPARLVPVWPCAEIGLHHDVELGRRSYREFLSYGNEDFSGWSYTFQACIAARLGLAAEALRELGDHFTYPGGLTSHNRMNSEVGPVFQIEALLAAPAAINEMLVHRTPDGVIRLFPAWPTGTRARFENLRVPGGILVSAEFDGARTTGVQLRAARPGKAPVLVDGQTQLMEVTQCDV